jgi:presenilin-like A22 family membrane protease
MGGKSQQHAPHHPWNALEWTVFWLVGVWGAGFLLAWPLQPYAWAVDALIEQHQTNLSGFVFSFLLALCLVFLLRHRNWFGTILSVGAATLVFSGFTLFLHPVLAIILAVLLWVFERTAKSFFSNGVFVTFLAVFGGVWLSVWYEPSLLLIGFIFLSIYDVFGVFASALIPHLAERAIAIHAPMLFIIPAKTRDWFRPIAKHHPAAVIGVGDAIFPTALLATSVIHRGLLSTLPVFGGLILGLVAALMVASRRHMVPMFPFLCIGALIGWFW